MKHLRISILAITLALFTYSDSIGQPPPPSGGHGSDLNQSEGDGGGGGAPLGGGTIILSLLAAGYGLKKWHSAKSEK